MSDSYKRRISSVTGAKRKNKTLHSISSRGATSQEKVIYSLKLVIFEQGDPAKVFYILKEGKLQIEMGLDIQSNNKYPIVRT